MLLLFRRRDPVDELADEVRIELREVRQQLDMPVQPDRWERPGRQVEVGRTELDSPLEQRVDGQKGRRILVL